MNTQVHLNSTKISILSIPKDKYWIFSSAVLQLLHLEAQKTNHNYETDSETESSDESSSSDDGLSDESQQYNYSANNHTTNTSNGETISSPIDNSSKKIHSIDQVVVSESDEDDYNGITESSDEEEDNYFFHIAFTPEECTLMCASSIMQTLFHDPLELCKKLGYDLVQLLDEEFITLQVDSSDGYDNSSKVLQLTKPLSTNKIPLFFLSTHFGDIVLIPQSSKERVVEILTSKNFEFSNLSNSYINVNEKRSSKDTAASASPNLDIEQRAFELFNRANVKPIINKSIKLLLTGSRSGEVSRTLLKTAQNLASTDIQSVLFPQYFAVTRTSLNEVSLLLPKSSKTRAKMGFPSKYIIGSTQDSIIPVTIDLNALPLDSTGIVAGLASRLLSGNKRVSSLPLEMSYLSMAKSGIIMIPKENIALISAILKEDDHLSQPIESLQLE
ncbi:hypothetical protein CAAN1_05S01332 [[Candida] anglica]|uniref:CASTOR ACT domain-containing protein n=1 Tax=[Candida] anglica TaxID=148631 RepID=A0ABP0EEE7_9ASCO